jgi:nucleoside-diphosphate-sugar epimerase
MQASKIGSLWIASMYRILIAGCGYVGGALAASLAGEGNLVFGLRRRPVSQHHGVQPIAADLTDSDTLRSLPRELDFVFYTISSDERSDEAYRKAYVQGLTNLLKAMEKNHKELKRFFLASSTGVYEQEKGEWVDESSPAEPTHFSGRRLLEAEQLLATSSVPSTVVRFGGIYGPGRTRLIRQLLAGQATYPVEENRYTNRIHRDDCAGALAHLMSLPSPEALYLGVDDEPVAQRDLLHWLAESLNSPPPRPQSRHYRTRRGNKRCRNDRLRASGYRFRYPNFRAGYQPLLKEFCR